jgi:N-methylhydantoinase A
MATRAAASTATEDGAGGHRIAVDVGGTFIDFVLVDEQTGAFVIEKQPSTAGTLVDEFIAGLRRLPIDPGKVTGSIFHGTTAGINAIVQERGARVGLITTEGFRDVLELGRGGRSEIYNVFYRPPQPLVPRRLRRTAAGRMLANGNELDPLDEVAVEREAAFLVGEGIEAIAICFLHSYARPEHERRAANIVRSRHPQVHVAASHEITTEWREFERTSTTVLNAYLQPLFSRYLSELGERLSAEGYRRPMVLMQSSGGVISAEGAGRRPIRTLESGPAGGVIGAQALARLAGYPNVICADVGGTTYDVALIENGAILEATATEVNGRPIVGPIIDMTSIGAGGGSIAWIDSAGGVRVGPQSAGAHPGPASFGRGGTEPTVTDCHLVLGRLDPENFLGARMKLDSQSAARAIKERIADPQGLGLEEAARGILSIAETNMTYAIRAVTVERGVDPRDYAIFSYGGGGGLFAAPTAQELGIATVVIPRAPANFSALGILVADYREDAALTHVQPFNEGTVDEVMERLEALRRDATGELLGMGLGEAAIDILYRADLRFAGQDFTITIPVEARWFADRETLLVGMQGRFVEMHAQLYGHGSVERPVEIVNCRCRATGRVAHPAWEELATGESGEPRTQRSVHFEMAGGFVETPIFDRDSLAPGQRIEGPAIVEEWTTTTIVPPGMGCEVDRFGNLVLKGPV